MKIADSTSVQSIELPSGLTVFERGWLSSNNILLMGADNCALIDSGYCTHAPQTLQLLQGALNDRPLDLLINTHLHSDHCGGNSLLQSTYPEMLTLIPPGHAEFVKSWDANALTYVPTGQNCPAFHLNDTLRPGSDIQLGDLIWQIHAAPGHDPHSVILFEPVSRTLISADALWERGFGVVFPELDGVSAFEEVANTLDLIESLNPLHVIPGHGSPFVGVNEAIAFARKRLDGFIASPQKHSLYAAKVLLKFKLLEEQRMKIDELKEWVKSTPYFRATLAAQLGEQDSSQLTVDLIDALLKSGAAVAIGSEIHNT
jgi:glyoxylase-like metal-dependent hydrolase (beta-lactamase superfamily II)